MAAVKTVCAPS